MDSGHQLASEAAQPTVPPGEMSDPLAPQAHNPVMYPGCDVEARRAAEEAIDNMEEMPIEGLMQAEAGVYGMIAATPDPAEGSWYLYAAVIPGLTGIQTEALRCWAVDQFVDLGTTADPRGCGWTLHPTGAWHKWARIA